MHLYSRTEGIIRCVTGCIVEGKGGDEGRTLTPSRQNVCECVVAIYPVKVTVARP